MAQTIHFSIGEDAGKLLMQIAQEHLLYSYNPDKAVKTLTDSLMGCPVDLAMQILKGDVVLIVNVKDQNISPKRRGKAHADFPALDLENWSRRNFNEIIHNGEGLLKALDDMMYDMSCKSINKTYDWSVLLDFISGNDEAVLEDLRETEEVSQLELLVRVTKEYIEKSTKIQSVIDWAKKAYPEELPLEKFFKEDAKCRLTLELVVDKFNEMMRQDFTHVAERSDILQNYIDASLQNDEILSKGIEPVDIMQNWSAGWLSPEGDYYALNGEIANMLHIQIADALQEKGVIPENDDAGFKINADAWLEQQGWVKIHGNNINFAGCLNSRISKTDIPMTQVQKDLIYEYGQRCHACMIRYGWKMIPGSAAKINLLTDDQLNKMFFDF